MCVGVFICEGASATLENNTITDNDWAGVDIYHQATATLTGNTIKGNGQCKIEQTEEELAEWSEEEIVLYRSPSGFPGVRATDHSTVTMPPGSNTIEGNGKVGSDGVQVVVDETSNVN
jgi:parallel beta-helix repeat protein